MIEVKNPYHQIRNGEQYYLDGFQVFEEGTQAGIKALIEWLFKPCTEHGCWRKQPRRLCRLCMQELEKEYK